MTVLWVLLVVIIVRTVRRHAYNIGYGDGRYDEAGVRRTIARMEQRERLCDDACPLCDGSGSIDKGSLL